MPTDEQGDKWACEPCIRGHRSTKCEHFDRFMLRVKKPGRPLSSCPHPRNQCSCGRERVMMVKIKKEASCLCAPKYMLGPDGNPLPPPAPSAITHQLHPFPPSENPALDELPRFSSDTHRVQKHFRSGSKIDPEHFARAIERSRLMADLVQRGNASATLNAGLPDAAQDSPLSRRHPTNPTSSFPRPPSRRNPRRLSQLASKNIKREKETDDDDDEDDDEGPPEHGGASCCETRSATQHPSMLEETEREPGWLPPASTGSAQDCPMSLAQTTQPPRYGSAGQTQETDQRVSGQSSYGGADPSYYTGRASVPGISQILPQPGPHEVSSSTPGHSPGHHLGDAPSTLGHRPIEYGRQGYQVGQTYMDKAPVWPPPDMEALCNCGPDCGCLACPVHYYNDTTQQHFAGLGTILDHDSQTFGDLSFRPQEPPFMGQANVNSIAHNLYNAFPHGVQSPTFPPDPPSSSGYNAAQAYPSAPPSAAHSRQESLADVPSETFDSSEYLTLEYPFDQFPSCSDANGVCLCDDSCQCMGCMLHKPPPPSTQPENQAMTENHQQPAPPAPALPLPEGKEDNQKPKI